jgi:hypothetical protein
MKWPPSRAPVSPGRSNPDRARRERRKPWIFSVLLAF